MFPNARDREFPEFFGEISGSREMAFGNADLYSLEFLTLNFKIRKARWHIGMTSASVAESPRFKNMLNMIGIRNDVGGIFEIQNTN